jgi:hypothetical protein
MEILNYFIRNGRPEMAEEMNEFWESADLTGVYRALDPFSQIHFSD